MKIGKGFFGLQTVSREKKMNFFMNLFRPNPSTTILDLGGSDGSYFLSLYPWPEQIVALDVDLEALRSIVRGQPIRGNGLHLPFKDGAFDVVWSNAVIEHVGSFGVQRVFAEEIQRVGKGYFVTTPWKGFPIELHYKLPLYQFVPKYIQRCLGKHFAIGWYSKGEWEDINLLWHSQFQRLFPEACTVKHRVTLWPETLIAYKKP